MKNQIAPAFRMMLVMTVLTGLIYPGAVTVICQALFPRQANGSLVKVDGRTIGSALIGQNFTEPQYFHPRPSAAGTGGYDPTASGGSNLGPTSQELIRRVKTSMERFRSENPGYTGLIPADMVTASGSGLDPDVSPASAQAQAARIARARGVTESQIRALIKAHVTHRQWGLLGEPRVNVLQLNLQLDRRFPSR